MASVEKACAEYGRDGVVAGLRVMTAGEAQGLLEELDGIRNGILQHPGATEADLSHLHYVRGDHPLFPFVDRIARDERLLAIVRGLLGPDVLIRNGDVFAKEPDSLRWVPLPGFTGAGQGIGWHRDDIGEGLDPQPFLTLWLALTPTHEGNGSLRYLRGSHRVELPHPPLDRGELTMRSENLRVLKDCEELVVDLDPGECVVHNGAVAHGSHANAGGERRVGIALRYMRADADPQLAGTGTAALVCGSGGSTGFSLQDQYTINWWVPRGAASGWTEVEARFDARFQQAMDGGDAIEIAWNDPEDRARIQGVGARWSREGSFESAWLNTRSASGGVVLKLSDSSPSGIFEVVAVHRDGSYERRIIQSR